MLLTVGALALWAGLTDAILRFLRHSMTPWSIISGLVLVTLGVVGLVVVRRAEQTRRHAIATPGASPADGAPTEQGAACHIGAPGDHGEHGDADEHRHGSRVGWMLLLPALVTVLIDPGALGAYAVSRQSGMRLVTAGSFDLEVTNAEASAAEWFVAPIVNVESLRTVEEPREPYEYP